MKRPTKAKKTRKTAGSYHHGDLKNALVREGLALIAVRRDFSIRDLAAQLGVSHAAAYGHFNSKEALLAAMAEQGFRLLGDALAKSAEGSETALELSRRQGGTYVRFALTHAGHYRIMFGGDISDKTAYPALTEAANNAYRQLKDGLAACQREGSVGAGDIDVMALATWSLVHGLVSLLLNAQLHIDVAPELLQASIGKVLFCGLQAGI